MPSTPLSREEVRETFARGEAVQNDNRQDTQSRILEAAGQVFAEKGFEGGKVREICARAGANLAAVNYYFRDKERLYIEAIKRVVCFPLGEQPNWPAGTSPTEKLTGFIHNMVRRLLDPDRPAWHNRLMMRELAEPTSACAELVRDSIAPVARVLQGIVGEMVPTEMPRTERYLLCFSIVGQVIYYCQNRPIARLLMGEEEFARLSPEQIAGHITRFSLAALGLGPALLS
jgi:AcrR family transcriptional regulator